MTGRDRHPTQPLDDHRHVAHLLAARKGAAAKLGQIAAFADLELPDGMCATHREVLAGLRRPAPAIDPDAIVATIEAEYGAPPDQVFASWEREPLATASLGQVHRAQLPDGQRVVTKVQHPGVAEALDADLASVESFAPLARAMSPCLEVRPWLRELRQRLLDELDFGREARYQQAFVDRYAGHPFVRIPAVHHEWCRPRVLVTEEMTGMAFEELAAAGDDDERQRAAEVLYRFWSGSLHRYGLLHADPRPGNCRFRSDGTVVFLDFGNAKGIPVTVRAAVVGVIDAVIAGDAADLASVLDAAGFVPEGFEPDWPRLLGWLRRSHRPIAADRVFTYTPELATEVLRSATDPRFGPIDVLRRTDLSADYLLLDRAQWGVNSLLGRLRGRANWHRISAEWLRDAPPATELGRREAAYLAERRDSV